MSDITRIRTWLMTYPGASNMSDMRVDFTDALPGQFGVFPAGLVETGRRKDIVGDTIVSNQYNFAVYSIFEKAPGDDVGALANAEWVADFQKWVQEQSVTGQAPKFGNINTNRETITAQNGALYDADGEGLAMYVVQLAAAFQTLYERR